MRLDWRPRDPEEWDAFALRHGWFWHTTAWRDFAQACGEAPKPDLTVLEGGEIIAIAPSSRLGTYWAPAVSLDADPKARERAWRECLKAHGGPFSLSPLVPRFPEVSLEFSAAAIRLGLIDQSLTTRVIDLSRPLEALRKDLSSRHRSALARVTEVDTCLSSSEEDFDEFRRLYAETSGGRGRPDEALRVLSPLRGRWVLTATGRDKAGKVLVAHVILRGDVGAYYALSASRPETRGGAFGHATVWASIRGLKRQVLDYELGIQHRGAMPHDRSSEKERNVALFKRGFGGRDLPLYVRSRP